MGRRNRPYYRLGAFDSRSRRDGAPIEYLGVYDPLKQDGSTVDLNLDRIRHWLSVGAQPSETVGSMLLRAGFSLPARKGSGRRQKAEQKV